MSGFMKLHRTFLEWEWYDDADTKTVFLHLLLTANWKDSRYRGHEVKAGSLVCGRKALSSRLNMSESKIRTCLDRLKSTQEITIKTTNKFSVLTLVKWGVYQGIEEESTIKIANNSPTTRQQLATSKEGKKERSKDKEDISLETKERMKRVLKGLEGEWYEFIEIRKRKKAVSSNTSLKLILNKLENCSFEVKKKMLENSIENDWKSIYPLNDFALKKENQKAPTPKSKKADLLIMDDY